MTVHHHKKKKHASGGARQLSPRQLAYQRFRKAHFPVYFARTGNSQMAMRMTAKAWVLKHGRSTKHATPARRHPHTGHNYQQFVKANFRRVYAHTHSAPKTIKVIAAEWRASHGLSKAHKTHKRKTHKHKAHKVHHRVY